MQPKRRKSYNGKLAAIPDKSDRALAALGFSRPPEDATERLLKRVWRIRSLGTKGRLDKDRIAEWGTLKKLIRHYACWAACNWKPEYFERLAQAMRKIERPRQPAATGANELRTVAFILLKHDDKGAVNLSQVQRELKERGISVELRTLGRFARILRVNTRPRGRPKNLVNN